MSIASLQSHQIIHITPTSAATDDKWRFKLEFPSLQLYDKEMTVLSAVIPYTIPNILGPTDNIMKYTLSDPSGTLVAYDVDLGDNTMHTFETINDALHNTMRKNNHYFIDPDGVEFFFIHFATSVVFNKVYTKQTPLPTTAQFNDVNGPWKGWINKGVSLNATNSWYPRFGLNKFQRQLFGMGPLPDNSNLYNYFPVSAGYNPGVDFEDYSWYYPTITKVQSLMLCCNWVGNSAFNKIANAVASIPINATFGGQIIFQPMWPMWFKVSDGSWSNLELMICDQNGLPLRQLLENDVTITVGLRNRQT